MKITATQAANQFGLLLEHVVAGGTVRITRYGRPIAELKPPNLEAEMRTAGSKDPAGVSTGANADPEESDLKK